MIYLIKDSKYTYRHIFNTCYKYEFKSHLNNRKVKKMISGEFIL